MGAPQPFSIFLETQMGEILDRDRESDGTREDFPRGLRVRLSACGAVASPEWVGICGVVTGYGRGPRQIRVRRDGRLQSETWHESYWVPSHEERG